MPKRKKSPRSKRKTAPSSSTRNRRKPAKVEQRKRRSARAGATKPAPVTRSSNRRRPAKSPDRRTSKRKPSRASSHKAAVGRCSKPTKPAPDVSSDELPKLRARLGLKQTHLAALLNVDGMTLSRWERGILSPRPWHRVMLRSLRAGADANFTWSRASSYSYCSRYDMALDSDFDLASIPDRLREILVAAHKAAEKPEASS